MGCLVGLDVFFELRVGEELVIGEEGVIVVCVGKVDCCGGGFDCVEEGEGDDVDGGVGVVVGEVLLVVWGEWDGVLVWDLDE